MSEMPKIESLYEIAGEFAAAFSALDGEEMQAQTFTHALSRDARCALIFQLLTKEVRQALKEMTN